MASRPSTRRRTLLAGAAGTLAATSGCVGELRNLLGRESTEHLTLAIASQPASDDPYAVRIANRLAENLQRVGVDAFVEPLDPVVLLRDVLVNHDFDVYVGRFPSGGDPDVLRTLLHYSYGEEAGWQNPFGYSNPATDELLAEQRDLEGDARVETVRELQSAVISEQPFTTIAFPDRITGYRTERFEGWPDGGPQELLDYLAIERTGQADTLEMLFSDAPATRNRNPIAVEYRTRGHVVDLLYEPLVRTLRDGEAPTPWLAESVEWNGGETLSAMVTLRETPWHDGEAVTAEDVTFTYEFLRDTSLGGFDSAIPTPRYRGRVSLVESVTRVDERTVRVRFSTSTPDIAARAFEVPILPEHVWSERTDAADLAGLGLGGPTTQAVVTPNEQAVGSGPLRFVEAAADQYVLFEAFPEHFLHAGDASGIPDPYASGVPFQQVRFNGTPSYDTAVSVLEAGDADATADGLVASVVPKIGRNDDVSLTVSASDDFYHVGYNCRNAPLSDPRFRRVVGRLLDRTSIVKEAFGEFATATEAPLREPWVPSDLAWGGTATLSFFGDDGTLDVPAARDAFRDAGYQFSDERLVWRGGN